MLSPFDGLAAEYDRYRTGYAPELYEALEAYGICAGARVLDVACGTGLAASALVARGVRVTGVDPSEPMLARARARIPGAEFVAGRAEALPFERSAFDGAVCAQAFHWFDRPRALAELVRVVRPGGAVAVWWKELMRGDAVRLVRDDVAREAGVAPLPPISADGFEDFEESALVDRCLHVIPWIVPTTVADFIGYERSRARAGASYGERFEAYLDALASRLGAPDDPLRLSYLHLLYLGRGPRSGA